MDNKEIDQYLQDMPDEVMERMSFSMPWQYGESDSDVKDPDGFPSTFTLGGAQEDSKMAKDLLQATCWQKFHTNPQVNTAVRGQVGRLTGFGFEIGSENIEIDELIENFIHDQRNRLYYFLPKYVGRFLIEGELYVSLTVHPSGFIECDFIDPAVINGGGDNDTGIIFHPEKTLMPLFYSIDKGDGTKELRPSIFLAYYPELLAVASKHKDFRISYTKNNRKTAKKYKKMNGFYRFIVGFDRGFLTKRAVSYLRTILVWLNHYENLKKFEIDHKKSAGSYLWIFKITEPRYFKQWIALPDEERRKTGIMSKKTPGSSLVLPPGMDVEVKNPQLPNISNGDTDLLDMISSGLNEPEDVMMSRSKGTIGGTKASRGPASDRITDEMAWLSRFLRFDLFGAVFHLTSRMTDFPEKFKVRECVGYDKNQEPIWKMRQKSPQFLTDVTFPTSEMIDYETRAKGLMGSKHGPVSEVLGIPMSEVVSKMGFGGYGKLRRRHTTEKEKYPELIYASDAESMQEKAEGEKKETPKKETPKKETPKKKEEK